MKPMLAMQGSEADLSRADRIFEPKMDGTRALCYKNRGIRFINRRENDITGRYPEFADFAESIKADECVLDGEVVVYNEDGNPDFRLLQMREHATGEHKILERSRKYPATYVVFDIVEKDGRMLADLELVQRKKILDETVEDGEHIQKIVYTSDGLKLWSLVKDRHTEGVMAKRKSGRYEPGKRSDSWLKIKYTKTVDCVVLGYTSHARAVTSLALGLYENGVLKYAGKVGTGFSEKYVDELKALLTPLETERASISLPEEVQPIRLALVCEVEYLKLTADGKLRAPVFLRMRDDKPTEECVMPERNT